MSEELKPCPFCGGSSSADQFESAGGQGRMIWIVGCENPDCEVTFQCHARKVDAIKAWNTRHDRAVIDGFLARVDERMQAIVFQGKNRPLADAYLEAKRQVYAEMFGGRLKKEKL